MLLSTCDDLLPVACNPQVRLVPVIAAEGSHRLPLPKTYFLQAFAHANCDMGCIDDMWGPRSEKDILLEQFADPI